MRLPFSMAWSCLSSEAAHVTLLGIAVDEIAYATTFRNWLTAARDNVFSLYLICFALFEHRISG